MISYLCRATSVAQRTYSTQSSPPKRVNPKPKPSKHQQRSKNNNVKPSASPERAFTPKEIERSVLLSIVSATRSSEEVSQVFREATDAAKQEKVSTEALLDGDALENVQELIVEEMEEGIEMLSENVVVPLSKPLAEEFGGIIKSDSATMNDFFLRISQKKLESLKIEDILPDLAKNLGAEVNHEQISAALNAVRASDASALVSSALATQFWKESMKNVIEVVSKDFARHAAQEVAALAQEIMEERMKDELTKLTHKQIEDMYNGSSKSKEGSAAGKETKQAKTSQPS